MGCYKTVLNIGYKEKDVAKRFGARWDAEKKNWYMPHFDSWEDASSVRSQDAYESLSNVNSMAKALNKDVFDIIPQYAAREEALTKILTGYACQMGGIADCSDVLFHPETYLEDLKAQKDAFRKRGEEITGISPANTSFLKRTCAVVSSNYERLMESFSKNGVDQEMDMC